eukprot:gene1454-15878_t
MRLLTTGLILLAGFVWSLNADDGSCPSQQHTNACSVPLSSPFPYEDEFAAACNKHDVCYFCHASAKWVLTVIQGFLDVSHFLAYPNHGHAFHWNSSKGVKRGWSRYDCDQAFLSDMEAICDKHYGSGRKRSFWESFKHGLKLAGEISKWPFITEQPQNCKQGAKIYFMAVDFFASPNYNNPSPDWCDNPCVIPRGNPNNMLKI